jgi:glycine/D-amino acid oxidase-like deaminating enzyme
MKTYDWIVIGAGITGAALSYELTKQGFSVLLVDRYASLQDATRFGYGGVAYWSGTTMLTRQLCLEGMELHRSLSEDLEASTEFRELDLVLPIDRDANPETVAESYAGFAIPPQLLSTEAACELEPLLNPAAISGALTVKHGHIHPEATARAYTQAFQRLGGVLQAGEVATLRLSSEAQIDGVNCGGESYAGANVVVCAGALSRSLLKAAGVAVRLYFTHAELLETPPVDVKLRSLVMPAVTQRFVMEAQSSRPEVDALWDEPGHEPGSMILDAGAIQFMDGSLRIGQISRTLTDRHAAIDRAASEAALRTEVGKVLPALQELPGTWHHCLVGFSHDRLPLIGPIPGVEGVHIFSGFSNPLAIVPPLARRYAAHLNGQEDKLLTQLSPDRLAG